MNGDGTLTFGRPGIFPNVTGSQISTISIMRPFFDTTSRVPSLIWRGCVAREHDDVGFLEKCGNPLQRAGDIRRTLGFIKPFLIHTDPLPVRKKHWAGCAGLSAGGFGGLSRRPGGVLEGPALERHVKPQTGR